MFYLETIRLDKLNFILNYIFFEKSGKIELQRVV